MEQLLTPEAAAEKLAVSVKTVKNLLRSGKLRGVKVGNLWRLRQEALEDYLRQHASNKPVALEKATANTQPWQDHLAGRDKGKSLDSYKPRTPLGRRLWEIRSRIIASGEPLLGWEEIEQEVAERRGEAE
jgi:excisionase family DNA binding protein